jgi:hypothetical protein
MTVRQYLVGSALSLVVGACWRGSTSKPAPAPVVENKRPPIVAPPPRPPQTDAEIAMEKFAEFEAAMCACATAECAKQVSDDITKWAQEQASKDREPPKMTEADTKRATEIGTHMGECMMKAMGAGQP